MEGTAPIPCQWNRCQESAVKHAVFGRRVFESADDREKADTPFITKHRDLCERHIYTLREQYVDVVLLEIDTCRDHSVPVRRRRDPLPGGEGQ